jgi:hypothetical protein
MRKYRDKCYPLMMKDKTQNCKISRSLSKLSGVGNPKGRKHSVRESFRWFLKTRRNMIRKTYKRLRLQTTKRGGKIWLQHVMIISGSRPLHVSTSNNFHRHCVIDEITVMMQMLTLTELNDV